MTSWFSIKSFSNFLLNHNNKFTNINIFIYKF